MFIFIKFRKKKMSWKLSKSLLLITVCLITFSACGAWQKVRDTTVKTTKQILFEQVTTLKLDLKARENINFDEKGRPLSVAVRVYQLQDKKLFEKADYNSLLEEDKIFLKQDLLELKQYVIRPSETISINQKLHEKTKFIGIVAFYHSPAKNDKSWMLLIDKQQLSNKKILPVTLIHNTLQVETKD